MVAIVLVLMEIAVALAVPAMVVFDAAVFALPVAIEKPCAVMMWSYPNRTTVGRPSPIARVPPVVMSHRIPISIYPDEARPGSDGSDRKRAWRRRRSDLNPDGNLAEGNPSSQQNEREQFLVHALSICTNFTKASRATYQTSRTVSGSLEQR